MTPLDPLDMAWKEACDGCQAHISWIDPCTVCDQECTWCMECTEEHAWVCPNCSGELRKRMKRTQKT